MRYFSFARWIASWIKPAHAGAITSSVTSFQRISNSISGFQCAVSRRMPTQNCTTEVPPFPDSAATNVLLFSLAYFLPEVNAAAKMGTPSPIFLTHKLHRQHRTKSPDALCAVLSLQNQKAAQKFCTAFLVLNFKKLTVATPDSGASASAAERHSCPDTRHR